MCFMRRSSFLQPKSFSPYNQSFPRYTWGVHLSGFVHGVLAATETRSHRGTGCHSWLFTQRLPITASCVGSADSSPAGTESSLRYSCECLGLSCCIRDVNFPNEFPSTCAVFRALSFSTFGKRDFVSFNRFCRR